MKRFVLLVLISALFPTFSYAEADCLATPYSEDCYGGLPIGQYYNLLDEMVMHPAPDVEPLEVNTEEVYRYAFRSLNQNGGVPLFDAPNGSQIGVMSEGFTYVTTMGYEAGWVMIREGQWVRESDTTVIQPSIFAGAELTEDSLNYPLAWVLLPEYPAPYPGAEGDQSRERIERYTLVSIFAAEEVNGWLWYLVAPDSWIKQTSIGKVVLSERPANVKGHWVAVDLYEQVLVAYEDDRPVYATLVSTGLERYPTYQGTFQTWQRMLGDNIDGAEGRTDFYSLDAVPWVMYYDDNFALHGTYWHDRFGYRASHGCVNLTITDAHWLYDWTLEGGYEKPWVYIFSSGEYRPLDES